MVYCSHCGTTNKSDSKFCNNCGALLAEPTDVRCAICGSPNKVGSTYCGVCGGRLESHPTGSVEERTSLAPLPSAPHLFPARTVHADQSKIAEPARPPSESPPPLSEVEPSPAEPEPMPVPPTPPAPEAGPAREESVPRRMPEWVARLQSAPQPGELSGAKTEGDEGRPRTWLGKLHEADEAAGNQPVQGSGDWLANLRATAMIELESAPSETARSAPDTGPTPIPRWFAYIRPPLGAPSAEPPASSESSVFQSKTDDGETQQPSPLVEGTPASETAGLPDWLVELQSISTDSRAAPAVAVESEPPPPQDKIKPAESQEAHDIVGQQELPEWVHELTSRAPDQGTAPRADPESSSLQAGDDRENRVQAEVTLAGQIHQSSEEDSGLPDWLTTPIETEELLARVQDNQPQRTQANLAPAAETENARDEASEAVQSPNGPSSAVQETKEEGRSERDVPPTGLSPDSPAVPASAAPTEISTLHGRLSNRISELQERLRQLFEHVATPREAPLSVERAQENVLFAKAPASLEQVTDNVRVSEGPVAGQEAFDEPVDAVSGPDSVQQIVQVTQSIPEPSTSDEHVTSETQQTVHARLEPAAAAMPIAVQPPAEPKPEALKNPEQPFSPLSTEAERVQEPPGAAVSTEVAAVESRAERANLSQPDGIEPVQDIQAEEKKTPKAVDATDG